MIRVQSDTCHQREYNLAMKNKIKKIVDKVEL